jgi:hypothetical protein
MDAARAALDAAHWHCEAEVRAEENRRTTISSPSSRRGSSLNAIDKTGSIKLLTTRQNRSLFVCVHLHAMFSQLSTCKMYNRHARWPAEPRCTHYATTVRPTENTEIGDCVITSVIGLRGRGAERLTGRGRGRGVHGHSLASMLASRRPALASIVASLVTGADPVKPVTAVPVPRAAC